MRLLITGASGTLGRYLVGEARRAGIEFIAWGSPRIPASAETTPVELTDPASVAERFHQAAPTVVIHAAAMSRLDDCLRDPAQAQRINVQATSLLAQLCRENHGRLLYLSTDLVFDGSSAPYRETDQPRPLSCYGKSKLDGELQALTCPETVIARVSWLVAAGPESRPTFLDQQVKSLKSDQPVRLFVDEWRTPLGADAAALALVELARSKFTGVIHLGGPQRLSRYEMGLVLAEELGADPALITPVRQADVSGPEPRPRDVSLDSSLWRTRWPDALWPDFRSAVRHVLAEAV